MNILIVDPCCPKQYDLETLLKEAMGGTESTTVRLAEALSNRGHKVRVTQHNRTYRSKFKAEYTPFGDNGDFKPSHVIVLRAPLVLRTARRQYPSAKLYLHCHDLFAPIKDGQHPWVEGFKAILETQAVPIVVSDFHQANLNDTMLTLKVEGSIPSRRIYNPIDDDLRPDNTPVDKNKLIFFSSPHKGLEKTLKTFERFQDFKELKEMKLYVANPGYIGDAVLRSGKVIPLGQLSYRSLLSHVRSSLATFHLNTVFPETMGLVYAESNAVGTPFLSHRLGAVPELADHPGELIDVNDTKAVVERVTQWATIDRPRVRGNPNFRTSKIVREWEELLAL